MKSIDDLFKEFEAIEFNEDEYSLDNICPNENVLAFFDDDYFSKYQQSINNEVAEIRSLDVNAKVKGAYLSACIKRHKRDIVRDYILKIAVVEKLDLTQRIADLFFIKCLGRSVGEFYLNKNFAGLQYGNDKLLKVKRTSQVIILNPQKKQKIEKIIDKYDFEIIKSIELIKEYFYLAKYN